jgi:hypothetical protein
MRESALNADQRERKKIRALNADQSGSTRIARIERFRKKGVIGAGWILRRKTERFVISAMIRVNPRRKSSALFL